MIFIISFESRPYNRRCFPKDPHPIVFTNSLGGLFLGPELLRSVALRKPLQVIEGAFLDLTADKDRLGFHQAPVLWIVAQSRTFPAPVFVPKEMEGEKAVLIDFDFAAHVTPSYLLWFPQVK